MYGLLAFVSVILLAVCFYVYAYASNGNVLALIGGIVFLVATVGFGAVFLSGRVNKKEDIHITE
jgi:ABC-type multidrug transport system permease subunit